MYITPFTTIVGGPTFLSPQCDRESPLPPLQLPMVDLQKPSPHCHLGNATRVNLSKQLLVSFTTLPFLKTKKIKTDEKKTITVIMILFLAPKYACLWWVKHDFSSDFRKDADFNQHKLLRKRRCKRNLMVSRRSGELVILRPGFKEITGLSMKPTTSLQKHLKK